MKGCTTRIAIPEMSAMDAAMDASVLGLPDGKGEDGTPTVIEKDIGLPRATGAGAVRHTLEDPRIEMSFSKDFPQK